MLKWLVTRGPTTSQPPRKVVTDDPLATLRVKTKDNTHQIYAVSRVNPLYHDEEVEIAAGLEEEEEEEEEEDNFRVAIEDTNKEEVVAPESPPTDRGSVRSSGYGSKETDSVSEGSSGHDEDYILGAEVEAALNPPPAPSPFGDSHKKSENSVAHIQVNDVKIQSSVTVKDRHVGSSQSVAQLRKSFENFANPEKNLPTILSAGGKPVASIIAQHPQFVKAIEIGMRRAKSLETVQQQQPALHNSGSSTVPRPIWPKVSNLVQNPGCQGNKNVMLNKLRESMSVEDNLHLHARIPSPVDIVKQDIRYVTSIHVTPKRPLSRAKTFAPGQPKIEHRSANNPFNENSWPTTVSRGIRQNKNNKMESNVSRYFGGTHQNPDFNLLSLQPDSLVTEDTLRMMRYGVEEDPLEEENELPIHVVEQEVPAPLPDFSQVIYTRGLYATLTRAASLSTKDIVKPPYKTRSRSLDISIPYHKSSAKKKGLSAMKGLWERSGLKTNGRKLIVDVNDLLDSSLDENDVNHSSVENLRSFQSTVMNNAMKSPRQENSMNSTDTHSSLIYEEPMDYNRNTSQRFSGTMESRFSDTYAEINDNVGAGIDNPAFLDDSGQRPYFSPVVSSPYHKKPRFLDPEKLAEFQKKISEKLQGAPHHRTQWLDLDEIVIEGAVDKQERRVKFTSDTINPGSLERNGGGGHHQGRGTIVPGGAVRTVHEADIHTLSGRQLPELTLEPSHLLDNIKGHKNMWTSSESYRDRFQEAPAGTIGRGKRQQLWESYYGSTSSFDRTLPRRLAPHPNSQAPICGKLSDCPDFTLDLRRSHKLNIRSVARQKRRRCYVIILVFVAFVVFVGMVVVISWYSTRGEKFFGPL
ncbi:uncharacterized protein [Macrobrachium rosenbergii]|uniref:uncharacterized protein isoform X2 n=1 Tax=Macrobrachium rosenbergii TaxID=79674 RepID=UPI0034D6A84E